MSLYRLPNSKVTESEEDYAKAWEDFAKPLCLTFGWELRGFNPAFQFETTVGRLVTLDVSVVVDLRAGLRTLHAHIESLKESNQINQAALKRLLALEEKTAP